MDLNNPIAVVAILAGVTVMIREAFFFARSMSKNKNGSKFEEKLLETLATAQKAYEKSHTQKASSDDTKLEIKRAVGKVILQMVNRNPIIMPILVKV